MHQKRKNTYKSKIGSKNFNTRNKCFKIEYLLILILFYNLNLDKQVKIKIFICYNSVEYCNIAL